MNFRVFLCSLALLCAAATMARRCERRRPAAPHTFLKGGSSKSVGKPKKLPYLRKECGTQQLEKIVGGDEVGPSESPWTVALFTNNYFGWTSCSGTLVNDRYVVTAAHCVVNTTVETVYQPSYFQLLVGTRDLKAKSGSAMMSVKSVWPHEGFMGDPYFYNDIAVLVLTEPVDSNLSATPVCLPLKLKGMDLTGRDSITVGWGSQWSDGPSSDVLKKATLRIVSQKKCQKAHEGVYNITSVHICAATVDGSQDTCQGDSGGPLVTAGPDKRMYLVGVVSFGTGCAIPRYPGVYARVTEFLDWLDARLRGVPPPKKPKAV